MRKIEKIIASKGSDNADISKQDLNQRVQKIYDAFIETGVINWSGKVITTKEEFMTNLIDINNDRHTNGYTTLTEKELKEFSDKIFAPCMTVPMTEFVALENEINETYNNIFEQITLLQIQLDRFKCTMMATSPTKEK